MTSQPQSAVDLPLEAAVWERLRSVTVGPGGPDVVSAGLVHDVVQTDRVVRVLLDLERLSTNEAEELSEVLTPLLRDIPGVERVVVKPRPMRLSPVGGLPGIRRVIGVHSGKGGVGKSTIAANLAVALAGQGLRVGFLDADVYGPSAPLLFGLTGRVNDTEDGRHIAPREAHGLKIMSLGFLMPPEKALTWRGSLVDEGLPQLIKDVAWGTLDVLVIDMPPGTSDVHIALAQHACLDGVLTVTAPGQVSVQDVRRGLEMFADMAIPALGLIENMAAVACGNCGNVQTLFGAGGGDGLAAATGLTLLARLPLEPAVTAACDAGTPAFAAEPDSAFAQAMTQVAARVAAWIQTEAPEAST